MSSNSSNKRTFDKIDTIVIDNEIEEKEVEKEVVEESNKKQKAESPKEPVELTVRTEFQTFSDNFFSDANTDITNIPFNNASEDDINQLLAILR